MLMQRITSGIPGFDKIVGGGIPEGYMVLVSGGCGAGKTVFGMQFLCSHDEGGIYVSFGEEPDQLREISKGFGWHTDKMEKSKKFRFLRYDPFRIEDIFEIVENNIKETQARRIVIDSISSLGVHSDNVSELRRTLFQLDNLMKKNKCTTILVSEITEPGKISKFGIEEFVCDGVVVLENTLAGTKYKRRMHIMKMRGSEHSLYAHEYVITHNGMKVM